MKSKLNRELVNEWKLKVGGYTKALALVKACLKCSESKADKIASGRYPSTPSPLERKALAKLMKIEESALFVDCNSAKSIAS